MNHSSESKCRSYPSPLIHPLDVPLSLDSHELPGQLGLSAGTPQGSAEKTLLLPSHVLGQHSSFNSSTVSQHKTELVL